MKKTLMVFCAMLLLLSCSTGLVDVDEILRDLESSSSFLASSSSSNLSSSSSIYAPDGMIVCLWNNVCAAIDSEICLQLPGGEIVYENECP